MPYQHSQTLFALTAEPLIQGPFLRAGSQEVQVLPLEKMANISLEQTYDLSIDVINALCRRQLWQAWHGHNLSADHHDELGACR